MDDSNPNTEVRFLSSELYEITRRLYGIRHEFGAEAAQAFENAGLSLRLDELRILVYPPVGIGSKHREEVKNLHDETLFVMHPR